MLIFSLTKFSEKNGLTHISMDTEERVFTVSHPNLVGQNQVAPQHVPGNHKYDNWNMCQGTTNMITETCVMKPRLWSLQHLPWKHDFDHLNMCHGTTNMINKRYPVCNEATNKVTETWCLCQGITNMITEIWSIKFT